MDIFLRVIKMVLGVVIIATIAGLLWWFFFLRAQVSDITATDAARGLNDVVPSFTSAIGSTYKNIVASITGSATSSTESNLNPAVARLRQIDSSPVAGMGFVGTSTTAKLLYVQTSTGYVLASQLTEDSVMRLTNTLLPKSRAAYITNNGGVLIQNTEDDGMVRTFFGSIATSTATSTISDTSGANGPRALIGKDLAKNILQIAIQPKTSQILYATPEPNGGSSFSFTSADSSKPKSVFTSPLREWRVSWLSDSRVILATKPADDVEGYIYQLSTNSGVLTPLLRDIPGLTALFQASTTAVLFSSSANGTISLYAATSSKASPEKLSIKTVSEKCVWGSGKSTIVYCAVPLEIPSRSFLNDWYRGVVHTNDSWWQIDIQTGSTTKLMETHDVPLDVQKPTLDPSGGYIAFINGEDQSLWLLRVRE